MRSANQGFTLLELLVAVTILAVIAVISWRGLDGVIRSREVVSKQTDAINSLEMTFEQLAYDAENVISPEVTGLPVVWTYPEQNAFVLVRRTSPLQLNNLAGLNTAPNTTNNSPMGGIQVVLYRYVNQRFVRRASPVLQDRTMATNWITTLEASLNQEVQANDPVYVPLLTGVQGLSLRGWRDTGPNPNQNNSQASWQPILKQADELTKLIDLKSVGGATSTLTPLNRLVRGLEIIITVSRSNNPQESVRYTKLLMLGS